MHKLLGQLDGSRHHDDEVYQLEEGHDENARQQCLGVVVPSNAMTSFGIAHVSRMMRMSASNALALWCAFSRTHGARAREMRAKRVSVSCPPIQSETTRERGRASQCIVRVVR